MSPAEKEILVWLVTDKLEELDDWPWSSRAERRQKLTLLVDLWKAEELQREEAQQLEKKP